MTLTDDSTKVTGVALATPWSDARKGVPYVARLAFDPAAPGGFDRQWVGDKEWYRNVVRAVAPVDALKVGDVLETREAPSWKNDHRYYYHVIRIADLPEPQAAAHHTPFGSDGLTLLKITREDAIRLLKSRLAVNAQ